jgi:outer membrane protein assembly factor BamD
MTRRFRPVRPFRRPGVPACPPDVPARLAGATRPARTLHLLLVALSVIATSGCFLFGSRDPKLPAPGSVDADKFLFDRGTAEINKRHWVSAREYFKRLVDSYPQSKYRQDAKLGVGETYLGENSLESNVLAVNEFRDFITLFPLNPKADYAEYKMILAYSHQMLGADRDQTATQDTLKECDSFLKGRPSSDLRPEVERVQREARDRLSESEFKVGLGYYRARWFPGAISRFKGMIQADPEYVGRDGAYYYLGEMYHQLRQDSEALPYYDRIVTEFQKSSYMDRAKKRIAEIKH